MKTRKSFSLFAAFLFMLAIVTTVRGAGEKPYPIIGKPGPDKIKVWIRDYNGMAKRGMYYLNSGATLATAISESGGQKSCAKLLTLRSENPSRLYRFREMTKAELESVILHNGDKITYECSF